MGNNYDVFVNNSVYPDANEIFNIHVKSISEIKETCFFVIDTNALLVPFGVGSQSLEEIKKVFEKLKGEKRLIIPGQVAREFANNRPEKLKIIYQQLNNKQSKLPNFEIGSYPLLEGIDDYKKLIELDEAINNKIKEYGKLISSVIKNVKNWQWNDPVSAIYRQIFTKETILDLSLDKDAIQKDLNFRYLHKIPPGYKDSGKEDDGVGDLLIWMTILELSKQGKDVLFVSSDEKSDWFYRSEKTALYPRFELINEFNRISKGKSFHIIKLSNLLKLFGANQNVVEEVATGEVIVPARNRFSISFLVGKWLNEWDINGSHPGSERFEIREDGTYTRNNEHIFNVENFDYNPQTNQISFIKASARPPTVDNRRIKNILDVVSNDLLSGTEDNYAIRYTRIKEQ